MARRQKR